MTDRAERAGRKPEGAPMSRSAKIAAWVILCISSLGILAYLFPDVSHRLLTRDRWIPKVAENGLVGYVDKTGAWVIPPQFDEAANFSEGLAAVTRGRGDQAMVGYIDSTGNYVIYPQFDWGGDFKNGRTWVGLGDLRDGWRNTRWGYIDKRGNVIPSGFER